jgi:hypothetical protein
MAPDEEATSDVERGGPLWTRKDGLFVERSIRGCKGD